MKPINVVFDLDCTLVEPFPCYRKEELLTLFASGQISQDDIIYACNYPHYIYPSCRELLQYIASITEDQLIFFSNAMLERNDELVSKLLETAFLSKNSANIIEKARIYSRSDGVDTTRLQDNGWDKYQPDPHYYKGMYGQMKKDLRVIILENQLPMTTLIDDDTSYITKGQEKNLLLVNGNEVSIETLERYDPKNEETIKNFTLPNNLYLSSKFALMNKLIYVAGILSSAYEAYQQSDQLFTEILWSMQFIYLGGYSPDKRHNEPYWWHGQKKAEFYHKGLERLRQFNDKLNFFIIEDDRIEDR